MEPLGENSVIDPKDPQFMKAFPLGRICVFPWDAAKLLSGDWKDCRRVAVQVWVLRERIFPLDIRGA